MTPLEQKVSDLVASELSIIWAAHKNIGLDGYMCLYTNSEQIPFRSKDAGINFWFGENDTQSAIGKILEHYNNGRLPNSPLLLNPIVHRKEAGGSYTPIGSGVVWCNGLTLGVDTLDELPAERLKDIGIFSGNFTRGENPKSGIKVLGFCNSVQPAEADGKSVKSCQHLYELIDVKSELYATAYFLSGIAYLTNNGLFEQPDSSSMFPKDSKIDSDFIKKHAVSAKTIEDAAKCWNAYDHHHSLYKKFGIDVSKIEQNLKFFNLVARDVKLFDATGTLKQEADGKPSGFEFIVSGLVPSGSITMLAAPSGVGKSSLVHHLCAMASTDYPTGSDNPKWLGQPVDINKCGGVNIFFAGEDGPQIFGARASMIDPAEKAKRLMFLRTDFGDGVSFTQYIRYLKKVPHVPILIVDPARKYVVGDESDTNSVKDFFDALEDFAVEKNSAVVVVHHLQRGATPKSSNDILDMLSGSQVFADRPRVVIGMYRYNSHIAIGLAKNSIPPNFGMVTDERVFTRKQENLSLLWLPGKDGALNNSNN